MGHNRSVVQHDVDLTEAMDHRIDHFLDAVFAADIRMDREGFRDFTDFRRSLLRQIEVEIGNDNFGFFLSEGLGRVLANSLSAAGNDDYFSVEQGSPLNRQDVYVERLSQSRSGFNVELACGFYSLSSCARGFLENKALLSRNASKSSTPNALIGGSVRIPSGFPLKTC